MIRDRGSRPAHGMLPSVTGDSTETSPADERVPPPPMPGVVRVFSGGVPESVSTRWIGHDLVIGRAVDCTLSTKDTELSRQHARLRWTGLGWKVVDLGSRNGTFVDGVRIDAEVEVSRPAVVRTGGTVFLVEPDLGRLLGGPVIVNDRVTGPGMHRALQEVGRAAHAGATLLIVGETGTGKEHAARSFHAASSHARGPFEAVNCAAIPPTLAEAMLFGAKKGAFSGAQEMPGHFAAADRGVLFLDEVGTLDLDIQAKLLRAIEHKVVQPLGASAPRRIDVLICCATNDDLLAAIDKGSFRRDLYVRLAQDVVTLPPLRDRREEIPYLLRLAVPPETLPGLRLTAGFVEACLLRPWPGNVRELLGAVGRAARRAIGANSGDILAGDLPADAGVAAVPVSGRPTLPERAPSAPPVSSERTAVAPVPSPEDLKLAAFREAYLRHQGNVDAAAREVGIGRSTAYRWLERIKVR